MLSLTFVLLNLDIYGTFCEKTSLISYRDWLDFRNFAESLIVKRVNNKGANQMG